MPDELFEQAPDLSDEDLRVLDEVNDRIGREDPAIRKALEEAEGQQKE
jgi:hypothetical protein